MREKRGRRRDLTRDLVLPGKTAISYVSLRRRLMAGQRILDPLIVVRIHASEPAASRLQSTRILTPARDAFGAQRDPPR